MSIPPENLEDLAFEEEECGHKMMPLAPREVLAQHAEQCPDLRNQDIAAPEDLKEFFGSRVVYYPGSGTDGHAISLFGGTRSAHCFVHCAFEKASCEKVLDQLKPVHALRPTGYDYLCLQKLNDEEVQQVLDLNLDEHFGLDANDRWPGPSLTGGVWAVLERQDNFDAHGPRRFALLHVAAEAVWLYGQLWTRRKASPYGILLQDHSCGGNWCGFGGEGSPLLNLAQQAGLPEWLLVGDGTCTWPGYLQVAGPETGGMHMIPRYLYHLLGKIDTQEQARACLSQLLSEWKAGEGDKYKWVVPQGFQSCRLLDFDIVAVDCTPDSYVVTANLHLVEEGSIENHQVHHYKITK